MITDDERREVVARLREWLAIPWYERPWGRDAMQSLGKMVGALPGENIVERITDLIDRPTCFDTESKDSKSFICSACGFSESKLVVNPFTLGFSWVKPSYRYCPKCGAMVVEKEKDDD